MSLPSGAFARVYRIGVRTRSGSLLVLQAESDQELPRVGVVAGRKVGHAVQRNRAKRRMREAVRRTALRPSMDYIVVALDNLETHPFTALCSDIDRAIGKNSMKMRRPTEDDLK